MMIHMTLSSLETAIKQNHIIIPFIVNWKIPLMESKRKISYGLLDLALTFEIYEYNY